MISLSKVVLRNIGCFKELTIDLNSSSSLRSWILVLGDNGVGKTTLLRCIAMGLCDETSASSLMGELYGDLIRRNAEGDSVIKVYLTDNEAKDSELFIETTITQTKSGYNTVKQKTQPTEFPWEKIFLCGYGAARTTFGTKDFSEYAYTDAVYTLFNYTASLQNPELVLRRLKDSQRASMGDILSWIDRIILLPSGSSKLGSSGITVSGPWGDDMPISALGDGYQSVITWLIDFLGWLLIFDESSFKKQPFGILLLDEIEQHLHPKWQRKVIGLINKILPNVQVIATSHAPLCVLGTTDLKDDTIRLLHLFQDENGVNASDLSKIPRGKDVDGILTSFLFGLSNTSDDETKDEIERYSILLGQPTKSKEDVKEIDKLKNILLDKLAPESNLEKLVSEMISKELTKSPQASEFSKDTIDLEVIRQIKQLLQ